MPPEIRNMIYRHVIAAAEPSIVHVAKLLACRRILNDAAELFLAERPFFFLNHALLPDALAAFRRCMRSRGNHMKTARVLKRVRIWITSHNIHGYARFEVRKERNKLRITPSKGRGHCRCSKIGRKRRFRGNIKDLCYCRLDSLARKFGTRSDDVLAFLEAWAKMRQLKGTF